MDPWIFTMDLEWSPPAVVSAALDVFDEHDVRCTLFLTNDLPDVDFGSHELAMHPNIQDLGDLGGPLDELLRIAPEAKGVRWHALFGSQRLYPAYEERGIQYESNVMMQGQGGIRPYRLTPKLWQVPIFFMDNMHIIMAGTEMPSFTPDGLALEGPGLRVFDFHPVHLALNTESMERYGAAKVDYQDPERLAAHRNRSDDLGIAVLLKRLLAKVADEGVPTCTLLEAVAAEEHR